MTKAVPLRRAAAPALLAMLALLAALALPGCRRQAAGPVVIDVWTEFSAAPQKTVIDAIVADFNQAHPGIEVRHTGFENVPYETALNTAFSGGRPPDIAEVNGGAVAFRYANAGLLADLSDLMAPLAPSVTPGVEAGYRYLDKAWGVPWQLSIGNMLWYNPAMLAARGVSPEQLSQWDGFLDAAARFRAAGVAPIAFGNRESWPGNHLYTAFARRLLTSEQYSAIGMRSLDPAVRSPLGWDDAAPVRAWSMVDDLRQRGYFTAGYLSDDAPTASAQFLNGKAPFYFMGSWFTAEVLQAGGALPVEVAMFPAIAGAPGRRTDLVTNVLVFTLAKASRHPEQARQFLRYLASEPVQRKWAEAVQGLAPYTYDTSGWRLHPLVRKIAGHYQAATSAAPFLDMLEDQRCNVPGIWEASVGVLTRQIAPQQAGALHEACVQHLRKARKWQ